MALAGRVLSFPISSCVTIPPDCLGVASGSCPSWVGKDQQPSAYMSECLALVHGAWVAARNFPGSDITFMSDCLAALGAAAATTA